MTYDPDSDELVQELSRFTRGDIADVLNGGPHGD